MMCHGVKTICEQASGMTCSLQDVAAIPFTIRKAPFRANNVIITASLKLGYRTVRNPRIHPCNREGDPLNMTAHAMVNVHTV